MEHIWRSREVLGRYIFSKIDTWISEKYVVCWAALWTCVFFTHLSLLKIYSTQDRPLKTHWTLNFLKAHDWHCRGQIFSPKVVVGPLDLEMNMVKLADLFCSYWRMSQFVKMSSLKLTKYLLWKCFQCQQLALRGLKYVHNMKDFLPDLSIPIFRPPLPPCFAPEIWSWYLDHMLSLVQFGEQPSAVCVAQT